MKRIKINLDRPQVDSKSIQAQKDFSGLMKNHALMSKPFYQSPWFMGVTGLASVSIVIGSVVAFQDPPEAVPDQNLTASEMTISETIASPVKLLAINVDQIQKKSKEQTITYSLTNQNQLNDKTPTLNPSDSDLINSEKPEVENTLVDNELIETKDVLNSKKLISNSDLFPRIGGKVNGSISKNELFDTKGITTESDVSIIHFELHLVDGLGGKVFQEEGNQLNDEMRAALKKINSGETIYFENIKGKTDKGDIVRLNPLRYVLMN